MKKTLTMLACCVFLASCGSKIENSETPQTKTGTVAPANNQPEKSSTGTVQTGSLEKNSETSSTSEENTPGESGNAFSDLNSGRAFFQIPELGLYFPVDASLYNDLTYTVTNDDTGNYALISSKNLIAKEKDCRTGVTVLKSPGSKDSSEMAPSSIPPKQFDGFFITATQPFDTCSDNANLQAEEKEFSNKVLEALKEVSASGNSSSANQQKKPDSTTRTLDAYHEIRNGKVYFLDTQVRTKAEIVWADVASFEVLPLSNGEASTWSKDANWYYYGNQKIVENKPGTTYLGWGYFRKDNAIWEGSRIAKLFKVEQADVDSFQVVDPAVLLPKEKNTYWYDAYYDAQDKYHKYDRGSVMD